MVMLQKTCDCGARFMTARARIVDCRNCRQLRYVENRVSRRLEREKNAPGSHTQRQWLRLIESQKERCYWCHRSLIDTEGKLWVTRDHFVPLVRGGSDSIENIVASCWRCNREKGVKTPGEYRVWLAQHGKPFIDISTVPASSGGGSADNRRALKRAATLNIMQAEQSVGDFVPKALQPELRYILQQIAERKRMEPVRATVEDFFSQKRRLYDELERRKLLKLA